MEFIPIKSAYFAPGCRLSCRQAQRCLRQHCERGLQTFLKKETIFIIYQLFWELRIDGGGGRTYWQNGQVTNVERIVVRRLAVDQPAGGDQTCKDQLQKCFLGSGWTIKEDGTRSFSAMSSFRSASWDQANILYRNPKKAYSATLPKSTYIAQDQE